MVGVAPTDKDLLRALPIFQRMPRPDREALLERVGTVEYPNGATIIAEASHADRMFVVLEGRVAFVTDDANGESIVLTRLDRGSYFGEPGLLDHCGDFHGAAVVAETDVVCAALAREPFRRIVAVATPEDRSVFDDAVVTDLRSEMMASIDMLADVDVRGDRRGVSELWAQPGDEIVREGENADAVYFVLDGIGLVIEHQGGTATELSRVGPGQCFGELGVVRGRRRAATVIAETPVHLLRVDADEFIEWHRRHPHLREFLATLERVYRIRDGRLISVYRGDFDGEPTITTVQGDPGGECVISTQVVDRDVVVFARRPGPDDFSTVEFTSTDGSVQRVLHVVDMSGDRHQKSAAQLIGVTARCVQPDLSTLYRAVVDGAILSKRDLKVFRATGHLGGRRERTEPDMLCSCLRVTGSDIESLEEGLADSFESTRAALGVGLVCGGCEAAITSHVTGLSAESRTAAAARTLVGSQPSIIRRDPELTFDAEILRNLRGTVELHVAATASANSNPGERFLTATVLEARPHISDPQLLADVDVFLEQEANHIYWHSQLNTILNAEVFPNTVALERARRLPLSSYGRFSLPTRLAVCAASEHAADIFFAGMFERYYARDATIHEDSVVDQHMRDCGIGELFAWHGREELEHRHVAFDVMTAVGTSYRSRVLGFVLVIASLLRHQVPALLAMRRAAGPPWRTYLRRVGELGRGVGPGLLAFLRPGFHPVECEYDFMDRLRADTSHIQLGQ